MLDRPGGGDAAVLVSLDFGEPDYEESLQELRQLVISAGMQIRATVEGRRAKPDAKYFIGTGKADELTQTMQATVAKVAVFNHDLSPSQQRNLERLLECRVADRTGLILDIFAQRAKSHEGKLQVELAQLEHLSTRLVRGWTHLERQKGGIGMRGGPGETQLELDRRMLRVRIKTLREKLDKLKKRATCNVVHANVHKPCPFRWSVIPMPESPHCLISSRNPVLMRPISCLQRWIPHHASCLCRKAAR